MLAMPLLGEADNAFQNGDFESGLSQWTLRGYKFTGYASGLVLPPKSLDDITLQATTPSNGISDVVTGPTQSMYEYFLQGAEPTTTLLLPESGGSSAIINLRPYSAPKSVSGTSSKPSGWIKYGQLATTISQVITSPRDNTHIRFRLAPVMENPNHTAKQQPFYAVQVNNLTQGQVGKNRVFFQWSYSGQAGVPWEEISKAGTNPGSNATYSYLDWQSFDILVDGSKQGDLLELIVLASGCSPGGHGGQVYLDGVTTELPSSGLVINVVGDSVIQAGQSLSYEYTVHNYDAAKSEVCVDAHMPQTQNTNPTFETVYSMASNFAGVTNPFTFEYNPKTNILKACLTSLQNGEEVKFKMDVMVPETWQPSYGPINNGNFPVYATGYNPVLGNLWQTDIVAASPSSDNSNLVIDLSGLKVNGQDPYWNQGDPSYSGYFTCTNLAQINAAPASCEINNLPDGVVVTGCTKDGSPWTTTDGINFNQVVTCQVSGLPSSSISREYILDAATNAANNINNISNQASIPFYVYNNPVNLPATLNDSPVLSPVPICCGRPIALYDLPIESDLGATYEIIATSGYVKCRFVEINGKTMVKVFGRSGSCTILGSKDAQISAPLILQSI